MTEAAPEAPTAGLDAATTRGFSIAQIIAEDVPTVDGRMVRLGAVEFRDTPLPLMAMFTSDHGGEAGPSVFVGNILDVARSSAGVWSGSGEYDDLVENVNASECYRLVGEQKLNGISVDMAVEEYEFEYTGIDEEGQPTGEMFIVTKGTVVGATVVPMPAQTGCAIQNDDQAAATTEDGTGGDAEPAPVAASALPIVVNLIFEEGCLPCQDRASEPITASGGPVAPPAEWFADPQLDGPTPLTITDDGRVFGHLASFGVCHTGVGNACVTAPKSSSDYAFFRTGVIRTADGEDVNVGQITLAGGHADLRLGARAAIAHYDDTQSAIADVAAGEDAHGIWLAGAVRPGVTAEQLRAFRASAVSGDWRPIRGRLELVAACSVNSPGFPIVRSRVASGQTVALIASGDVTTDTGVRLTPEQFDRMLADSRRREQERSLVAGSALDYIDAATT